MTAPCQLTEQQLASLIDRVRVSRRRYVARVTHFEAFPLCNMLLALLGLSILGHDLEDISVRPMTAISAEYLDKRAIERLAAELRAFADAARGESELSDTQPIPVQVAV